MREWKKEFFAPKSKNMKVFITGGVTLSSKNIDSDKQIESLKVSMKSLGEELVARGHEIVICSPFPDSADYYLILSLIHI